jgi:vancomycin resistance protein YoaR
MTHQPVTSARPFSPAPHAAAVFFLVILFLVPGVEAGTLYSHLWGGFATSLAGRSAEQRGNARRAALDLDGIIIAPGGIFSFNEHVGARDSAKGYTPAPSINDRGGLTDVPGGGICQLATTIYNAALEAGLEIVERHPHSRAVGYVPPGRDATILTWRKDLKLRNTFATPLMLKVAVKDERLTAAFWSVSQRTFRVTLHTDFIPVEPEAVVSPSDREPGALVQAGSKGSSAITRRSILSDGKVQEEIVSRDYYPAPSRILAGEGS